MRHVSFIGLIALLLLVTPAAAQMVAERVAAADAVAGERVARSCASCHTFTKGQKHGVGPNLWGVVGASIGVRPDFRYSQAMMDADGEWGLEELDAFLAAPRDHLPGTRMSFAGVKDSEMRADLIAWLATLSDTLPPAPVAEAAPEAEEPPMAAGIAYGGLPEGPGREAVFYTCNACHSLAIVRAQRLPRDRWAKTLDWMIEEQGMAQPAAGDLELMLDYLAAHFGPPS